MKEERKAFLREKKEKYKALFKIHGTRITLMSLVWGVVAILVVTFASFGYKFMDATKWGIYLDTKFVTSVANIMILDTSIIGFDFAFGGQTIYNILNCRKQNCSPEDRKNATYFLIALACCHTYLVSIGA